MIDHSTIESVAQYAERRCFGRVFRLQVKRGANDTIVIYGQAATYHAKQLAQHAVQEVMNENNVVNRIEVICHRC